MKRRAIEVDADFPGGNIVVEAVDGDDVRVHQDLRDTDREWFYWCFRVRGAAGRTLRFHFTQSRAIGVRGPGVSQDGGRTWSWLGADRVEGNGFAYRTAAGAEETRFSFAMPYQAAHWKAFAATLAGSPFLECGTLCTTPKGRAVEMARAGRLEAPVHRVAVTCRHHCCEMMANYALEGLVRCIVEEREAEGDWLRRNVEFLLVPFVDKDGVEEGDQGKDRRPRDHGRDYLGESLYVSTRAIRDFVPRWADGRLRVALDLHCPHISGDYNEVIYLVGSSDARMARQQEKFGGILESVRTGALPFEARHFLPFGVAWNTEANQATGRGFAPWAAEIPGVRLSTSMEIPYAEAGGAEVNADTARSFGRDLAKALCAYLSGPGGAI